MPADTRFSHIRNDRIRRVLDVWLVAGAGAMPPRRAIDPAMLGRELEIVWLCDVVWPGPDFRYRLAGEQVNAIYGRSLAGLQMEDVIPPPKRESVLPRYRRVVTDVGISHTAGHLYLSSARVFVGERIVLPLSEDGTTVTGVLGATAIDWSGSARPDTPVTEPQIVFTPLEPQTP